MATLTTHALAIKTMAMSDPIRGIFTNDAFVNGTIFGPLQSSVGGQTYDWNLKTSGVTGQTRAEGDAFGTVDASAFARPSLAYRLYDATIRLTRHLKAALHNNEAAYWPALSDEVAEGMKGVLQAVMTQWLGAAGEGIQLAIDSTGTYAGQDHAAVTGWNSYEQAVSAPLSVAVIEDMREALRDDPRGRKPNIALAPENQVTNYTRLVGPGAAQSLVTYPTAPGTIPNPDAGANMDQPRFGGIPIFGVPEMTDTLWFMGQRETVKVFYHEEESGDGGWKTVIAGPTNHQDDVNMSWFGLIAFDDPFGWGKLTGVTA